MKTIVRFYDRNEAGVKRLAHREVLNGEVDSLVAAIQWVYHTLKLSNPDTRDKIFSVAIEQEP